MDRHSLSAARIEELTYRRPNLTDFALDDNNLAWHCPLDNERHHTTPKFTLGILDMLPLEVLSATLVQLDLRSLTDFRRVNRRAMEVVDSVPQYKTIVVHAPASLRGILSIETGLWISCQDLYEKICTAECEQCGDFGGFLYLITCKRVCFLCLSEEPNYLPLLRSDAIRRFGLNPNLVASSPHMRSIPGYYSPNEKISRARLTLVDFEFARRAGIALHGSVSLMEQHVSHLANKRLEKYHERLSRRVAGAEPNPRRPPSGDAWDGRSSNPRRFMAIVHAPWLNLRTKSLEWGFHCVGCQKKYERRPLHWRRKFTTGTFNDHIRQCGDIMDRISVLHKQRGQGDEVFNKALRL